MHASGMAEDFPLVGVEDDARAAVTQLAENRLPGLVVTDPAGKPLSILPASQVVRILVPSYVQDDPALAGVLSESMADRVRDKLRGKKVKALIPDDVPELAVVNDDDRSSRSPRSWPGCGARWPWSCAATSRSE